MLPKVKFCGLKQSKDIEFVNILKPDFVGFVFHKESKRYIDLQDAIKLINLLDSSIIKVAVFVDYPKDANNYLKYFDFIQSRNSPGIKTIPIDELNSLTNTKNAQYFLLDKQAFGGKGEDWDYSIIDKFNLDKKKMFLAGGISLSNVEKAIKLSPFCIDISSSIENEKGDKDFFKMQDIITKIRGYN